MRTTSSFSDYQPIGHVGRIPIHVTTIAAVLYVVGMLVFTMIASARGPVSEFMLSGVGLFHQGKIWQVLTWSFVNGPNFFFLFGIFFFYSAGIEVERYLGRARYIKFYALTLLVPAVVLGLWLLVPRSGMTGSMGVVMVAVFIAFATLYPNIEYFGWVPLKYVAFACFAISGLQYFPERDWPGLTVLLAEAGVGFGLVRYLQGGGSLEFGDLWERINFFKRRPKFRVLPTPAGRASSSSDEDAVGSIDPLLDKIAKSGIASLTPKERARLEKARESLMKKDRQ